MIIELIVALLLGVTIGCFTGLLPAIHINLVSALLLASSAFFLSFTSPLVLVIFIVSMTISHTFLDFIPSVFLGAPDEDTVLSILPGHELLLKGKGYEAVMLAIHGCIVGIFFIIILVPLLLFILPKIYNYLRVIIFFILVFTNIYLIAKEKNSKLKALLVFLLSGFLGLSTLNLPVKESLLPLLTGLFASSSLITSIIKKQKLPKQQENFKKIKIEKKEFIRPSIAAVLSAPLCSFLPALGTGQAAVIGSDIVPGVQRREFLILLGIINAIISGLSFITLYSLGKARTGTAAAVQNLIPSFSSSNLLLIIAVILVSGILSFFIAVFAARIFSKNISSVNYRTLSIIILLFISSIVLLFSGFLGLLIFLVSSSTGLLAILLGVRRTHLMGSLMLPSILLYLPI